MHRTTISLESAVERQLKKLATEERRTVSELSNVLIKKGLLVYQEPAKKSRVKLRWHTAKGKAISGIDISDRSTYMDIISRKLPS